MGNKKQSNRDKKSQKRYFLSLRSVLKFLLLLLLALLFILALYAAFRFIPVRAVTYNNMEDHFKYGSIGGDLVTGIPIKIWQTMPLLCSDDLHSVAGDRLADDFLERVSTYSTASNSAEQRQALSREGYKALGFLYEKNSDGTEKSLPIGTSQRRSIGLDRTYINCAVCHTSTVRKTANAAAILVLGMPANLFNLYDFEQFIFHCAKNEKLNAFNLIPEIESSSGKLSLIDRYIVYPISIWVLRDAVQFLENIGGFSSRQPDWGPGRNDTFTNNKSFLYGEQWRKTVPDWYKTGKVHPQHLGTVDLPSTWLQGLRKVRSDGAPMQLHWDGNNDKVEERNLNAALATSALPTIIDHESLECIEQWMDTLEPPVYMFEINTKLAQAGEPIYQQYCMQCHGLNGRNFEGKYVGFVTPINKIGTDRYRLDNYTEELALNMATTYAGQPRISSTHNCPGGSIYTASSSSTSRKNPTTNEHLSNMEKEENSYRYTRYRKTNGYANAPLDGIWLRAPYLHNGSVPTLKDLLNPASERPKVFYRGNDIYDPISVGFESTSSVDRTGKSLFRFDVSIPGNANQGHEGAEFGTELPPEQKEALVEYLKTF